MACEVKTFANIKDFHKVQEFFGLAHDESWLNAVTYALSPTSELIAVALGEKLALLSSQWDNKSQLATFAPSWSGEIVNSNEIITSLICLPIYGKNVSSGPEWTCVAVGLSSGYVNFYTETGIKLFAQQCHDSAVYGIKSLYKRDSDESLLYILYDIGVCIFKGDDLFPFIISKKNHLGHNTEPAYGSKYFGDLETPEMIPYQKFKYPKDRECVINDTVLAGPVKSRTFDHIVQQSLSSGLYAKVGDFPAQSSLVLGVGTEPFLGLYYAEEGYRTISVGDVAKDVLGMVYKNVLGGFFSSKAPAPKTPEEQPAGKETSMRSGSRIYDGKRDGFSIWMAPGNQLAVIADNLDRVILIDCRRGVALRVWKGYRDAQCAFIKVKEKILKGDKSDRKKALFLIIYAPRMGCLEIWGMQYGPKVAAFQVSKNGQLGYTTHGLMGITTGARCKATLNSCLFLDPSDQSLKEITIPFHFALREANSKTARDIHLVRRLKSLLREDPDGCSQETVREICCDFQTDEVRMQCLEMMTKNKKMPPEFFSAVVHSFTSESSEKLKQLLEFYRRLTDFYIAMKNSPPEEEKSYETLSLSDSDLETIEQIMELLSDRPTNAQIQLSKVTFQVKHQQDGEFVEYLRVFKSNDGQPELNLDKNALFGSISENLFRNCFKGPFCEKYFKESAQVSGISSEDLIVLALNFWLEKTFTYTSREEIINDMMHLGTIVHAICDLAGEEVQNYSYNSICPWWQAVRELLLESPRSLSLMVAIVCRTVARTIRRSQNEGSCEEGEEEKWEQISQDEAQWSLLIGKLDDIAILGAILESPILSLDPTMTELPYEPPDCSLKAIVTKGKGVVSDLATKWLLYSRIHPTKILEKEPSTSSCNDPNEGPVPKRLQVLRRHFPFSLESGVILSLMSWEYMVHWSKELHSLDHMRASLICLGTFKEADFALKHGMCCMIWNATIKYPLQSTMKMIQKAGRIPDDKTCMQEVGICASLVADFLDLCLEFLMHFDISMNHRKRELKFEEILSDGQLPLHYIALQRNHAIQEILQLHIELCRVLQFIVFFQMKVPKPITTLFDAMANKTFFAEINKELPYVLPEPDMVLQKHREDFLCRVITGSMDLIREDLEQLYVVEHSCWMEKVYELADLWKLNRTGLKRHQIVEMYSHGWDSFASDLLRDMVDDMEMGKLLVAIAGRRLNLFSKKSGERFSKIASVGQQLLHYLDNLNENKSSGIQITATSPDDIDLVALTKLITVAYECLSKKESKFLHIAGQMFDACSVLQE